MWPWGHLAVAYLAYSLYSRVRFRRPPRPAPALAVGVGALFADLVDKPLTLLGVLPHGRFFAHALVFTAGFVAVAYAAGLSLGHVETATAFVVAHLVHLATDVPPLAYVGFPKGTEFLFWPFVSHPTFTIYDRAFDAPALVERIVFPFTHDPTLFLAEVLAFGLALALWYADGCPALEYVRSGR